MFCCPYFRGKYFELRTIWETAQLMAEEGFVPIIEPVKDNYKRIEKALTSVSEAGGRAVLVVNPKVGDLEHSTPEIVEFLDKLSKEHDNLLYGVILNNDMSSGDAIDLCQSLFSRPIVLIHEGFEDAESLAEGIRHIPTIRTHVFLENYCGDDRYWNKFLGKGIDRILIRDGFDRQTSNVKYPPKNFFYDLHNEYRRLGVNGFGDFLIVGDIFRTTGGLPFTVAIHLTYIDPEAGGLMYVRHFLSDSDRETRENTQGKTLEALEHLIKFIDGPEGHKVFRSSAIEEFRRLHREESYEGLGTLKYLSMKHHIEMLADYSARSKAAEVA